MTAQTRTELIEILSSGRFQDIVGTEEGAQIEFKRHAYNMQSKKDRSDLVADVSSFADHRGGTIVLGVVTERDPTSRRECASEVKTIASDAVDEDAYRKLVRAHAKPLVRDFEIRRYRESGGERELVALHIEAQDDLDKPFIVDLIVDVENPERVIPHAVGWPTRSGADTYWHDPARIQQLLAAGLRGSTPTSEGEAPGPAEEDAKAQLALIEERVQDWDDLPTYVIQAIPRGRYRIENFYSQFAQKARVWRGIRPYGFNLSFQSAPLVPVGDWLTLIDDVGPSVIIGRTGAITAACNVSPDFLGWAQTSTPDRPSINPTVLVEFTTEAIRFSYECVQPALTQEPLSWTLQCHARRWIRGSMEVMLSLRQFPTNLRHPTSEAFDLEVLGTSDAFRDAATLISEVLAREFDLTKEQVPYLSGDRIDLNLIPDR
jgi:hypothetical protein